MPPRQSAPLRSAAAESTAEGRRRARPPPRLVRRWKRGEEVDRDAVRIGELRVALAPERVPRLLLAVESGADDPRVELVNFFRAAALEGERELVARHARPVRPEAADDLLAVEHQAYAVRKRRLDVAVALGELDPELPIERHRALHVGADDSDCIQLRHSRDASRYRRNRADETARIERPDGVRDLPRLLAHLRRRRGPRARRGVRGKGVRARD